MFDETTMGVDASEGVTPEDEVSEGGDEEEAAPASDEGEDEAEDVSEEVPAV